MLKLPIAMMITPTAKVSGWGKPPCLGATAQNVSPSWEKKTQQVGSSHAKKTSLIVMKITNLGSTRNGFNP